MKEYKKFIKKLVKSGEFTVESRKSNTEKLIHLKTGKFYFTHPADHAIKDIQKWTKNLL